MRAVLSNLIPESKRGPSRGGPHTSSVTVGKKLFSFNFCVSLFSGCYYVLGHKYILCCLAQMVHSTVSYVF